MSKFTHHEQCPKCAENGKDRHKNNLGVWADGAKFCFSCGYRESPSFRKLKLLTQENTDDKEKAVLPSDFTREVPVEGWKWLLQYSIPMSYWKTRCGFTAKENRLVFTIGNPIRFSIGRALGEHLGASKWKVYGDKSSYVETVNEQVSGEVLLVEDLISAHKVGLAGFTAIPLFGTSIGDRHIAHLQALNRPVVLWLDYDQGGSLGKRMGRLQAFLKNPVRGVWTTKDPKCYNIEEIKRILK